jgi:rhodanese-related sulfurtransferase
MVTPAVAAPTISHAASSPKEGQVAGAAGSQAATARKSPAPECRISADALRKAPSPLLIDVRASTAMPSAWIPGAVRLTTAAIESSPLVTGVKIAALVGDGKDTAVLLHRCDALHKRGFDQMRVLDGGMPAWRRAGGALEGDAASFDRPLLLEERDVDQVMRYGAPTLLFVGVVPTPAWTQARARVVRASNQESPRTLLKRIRKQSGDPQIHDAIIVLADNKAIDAWRSEARALGIVDPYFHVGDASRYDVFVREQASIIANAGKPLESSCHPD